MTKGLGGACLREGAYQNSESHKGVELCVHLLLDGRLFSRSKRSSGVSVVDALG